MSGISILILTLDEEINIADCLASCSWCDDVVVLDSYSGDRTVELAQARGARVVQRPFDNYAAQRNFGLHEISYKHRWVLMLDADERTPPELVAEMKQAINSMSSDICLFRMRRKDFFFGRWLKRSSGYPTWFGRLVRPEHVRVEREINEEFITDGKIGFLMEHLHHFPFNKGVAWWYERHNRYSSMEATRLNAEKQIPMAWKKLISGDPATRRKVMKQIAYRLPLRPIFVFSYLYVIRLGILDGMPGFYFCAMRASYELMIDIKEKSEF